jgi:hypothetical protein
MDDAGMPAREFEHFAIRRRPDSGRDYRGNARVEGPLDHAGRVGILVSVEVNVAVDHSIRIAGVRERRIEAGVER